MGCGVVVSQTEPEPVNRYAWLKPKSDGTFEFYELTDDSWIKSADIGVHDTLVIGSGGITVNDDAGVTATFDSATHNLKKLQVKNGVIIELEVEAKE